MELHLGELGESVEKPRRDQAALTQSTGESLQSFRGSASERLEAIEQMFAQKVDGHARELTSVKDT
eukprot:12297517-Heterocapsa_arctica.AAC.1